MSKEETKPTRKPESDWAVLQHYWSIYGGTKALIKSPYLYLALLISALCYPLWSSPSWWDLPIGILPNLLGFSLAGYAIFLAFGNDGFRSFLSSPNPGGHSAFLSITTTFMHFVVIQITAIFGALIAKSLAAIEIVVSPAIAVWMHVIQKGFWAIGFILFLYCLTTSLAAVIAIFRLVRLFDRFNGRKPPVQ